MVRQVSRGQKGSRIISWSFEACKLARSKDGKPVLGQNDNRASKMRPSRPRGFAYTVVNAEQCGGFPAREPCSAGKSVRPPSTLLAWHSPPLHLRTPTPATDGNSSAAHECAWGRHRDRRGPLMMPCRCHRTHPRAARAAAPAGPIRTGMRKPAA